MAAPVITNPGDNLGGMYLGSGAPVDAIISTGSTPITWTIAYGSLPPGMSLTVTTGNIQQITGSGSPSGSYNFGVRATNADGTDVHNFYISIGELDSIYGLGNFDDAQEYAAYLAPVFAPIHVVVCVQMDSDGWGLSEQGSWPTGLSLGSNYISIDPTKLPLGTTRVTIRATNVHGFVDATYDVTIVTPGGGVVGSGNRNNVH